MAERRFVHNKCLCCGQEISSHQDFCSGNCETDFFNGQRGASPPKRL
jgi:predicted nucleic acid-binding Zn ribbon protein